MHKWQCPSDRKTKKCKSGRSIFVSLRAKDEDQSLLHFSLSSKRTLVLVAGSSTLVVLSL